MDDRQLQPNSEWFSKKPARLRTASVWATARIAAGLQNICGNRCRDGFGVLMYHRVAERVPGVASPTLNVTPAQFRRQLAGLLALGFEAWPLTRLVDAQRESRLIPSNVFAVTFDDGYENNYSNAWPILRELRVPATIFVATQYVDSGRPFPFDDWSASGSSSVPPSAWRPLSTGQCRELLADGLIELGAHTHSHGRFLGRRDEFRRDLRQSLEVLRDRFGIERPTFAFPYGDSSLELVDAAKELGVTCCLSTRHQRVPSCDEAYLWGRFDVESNDSPAVLAAKLSGWYSTLATTGKTLLKPFIRSAQTANHSSNSRQPTATYRDVSRARKAVSQP